jgi:iron complex outermembrane recepter protein
MNVSFGLRGILELQDGIPLSTADGYVNPEQADVLNADYIEVYRGADGLEFGAATLGGAINFVTPTGRSQPGLDIRTEFGSFGYRRGQVRYGAATHDGRLDAFFAISGLYSDGFRQNSKDSSYRFNGNVGYRFTPKSEGRLFITFERVDMRRPGAITLAQLQTDPSQAAPGAVFTNALIDLKPFARIAYKHTLLLGDSDRLSFYGQYFYQQFNNPTSYARYSGPSQDWGFGMRHEVNRKILGHRNRFVWGLDESRYKDTENTNGPVYFGSYVAEPNPGILQQANDHNALSDFYAQDSFSLTSTLTAVAGGQFAYSQRNLVATTPTPPTYYPLFFPVNAARNYTGVNPKLGTIWAPRPKAHFFANVSRSFEPPDEYDFSPAYSASVYSLANLDAQTATTVEGGVRGGGPNLGWDFSTYYSWVHKEIFSIESPPNSGNWVTFNRDHTRHSGVEAGAHGKLPVDLVRSSVTWNLTYTWSDFHFVNDPDFGNNRLPIVPPHFARLDLAWRHPSGFYIGPKLEVASDLFVDLSNTFRAPGYAVVGATVGYSRREGKYRIFLDLRNLGNKYYAVSTEYVVNAGGQDTAAFNPGLTRSVFGGIEVKLW